MKKYIGLTAVLLFVLLGSSAHAQDDVTSGGPIVPRHPLTDGSQPTRPPRNVMASTTKPMGTLQGKMPGMKEKPEGRKAIPGTVSALSGNGFTMTARGLGRDAASTTFTVVVSGTTDIKSGSTTATIADIVVGSKVEVFGKIATSTKTITADKIRINKGQGDMHGKGAPTKGDHQNMASGTPTTDAPKHGSADTVRGFLGGSDTSGTPAGTGFLDYISSVFFGWFK